MNPGRLRGHLLRRRRSIRSDQRGLLAGSDGMLFATLILLAGSLAVLNLWALIDTRAALDAAGREYLRAYSHASDPDGALFAGGSAASQVLSSRGTPVRSLQIDPPDAASFGPCQEAQVTIRALVPAARIPFLDDVGTREVRVEHRELVDAHREVTNGPRYDAAATPCGD